MLKHTTIFAAVIIGMMAIGAPVRGADVDDVKAAALAFAKALENGDAAAAKDACVGTEKELAMVDGVVNVMGAMKKMGKAATDKFGDAGKALIQDQGNPGEQMAKELENANIKVDGDTATVTGKGEKEEPLKMKKVGGKWKLDLSAMPGKEDMEKASGMFAGMAKAANETAADISAGKYKTVDEAKEAFGMKMMSIMAGAMAPTTKPAEK